MAFTSFRNFSRFHIQATISFKETNLPTTFTTPVHIRKMPKLLQRSITVLFKGVLQWFSINKLFLSSNIRNNNIGTHHKKRLFLCPIRQHQVQRPVDAQHYHQQRLYAMHYQRKDTRIRSIYPIKHHHNDDSKVPGTCPVGRRNNDCKRSSDKHHHSGKETKVLCKLEAIESYIEMIKIA